MATLKNMLPQKLFDTIDRAGISTPKQIIVLSCWDIKKLTNLRNDDIVLLKNVAADLSCPTSITCDMLLLQENQNTRINIGCSSLDDLLQGGLRRGKMTEIYGESGSGKTQVALQAAAHNWAKGSVYICTEDLFPVKRFEQIKQSIPNYSSSIDYGNNIFVEHVTESHELLSCVRVRLPKLLEKSHLSLIIIDSVAAPFRSEYTNYVQRAEDLRELAISLIDLAQKHNVAILCINQVTACFLDSSNVLPSLGLAWSNMVSTRLWLRKTADTRSISSESHQGHGANYQQNIVQIRELLVTFAPDLPNSVAKIIITPIGIQSIN